MTIRKIPHLSNKGYYRFRLLDIVVCRNLSSADLAAVAGKLVFVIRKTRPAVSFRRFSTARAEPTHSIDQSMRAVLFYNPMALLERLGEWAITRRRLWRLRSSAAALLHDAHIDTLELLEILQPLQPRIIYDVGTLLAKAFFPHEQIHAFEPLL